MNKKVKTTAELQGHLRRTRLIAWLALAALATLTGMLIHGEGRLPWVSMSASNAHWPTASQFRLRRVMLSARDAAAAEGDSITAAVYQAKFSQEARLASHALLRAWMHCQDPTTHLFPQAEDVPQWNYRNTAADLFGFLMIAAKDSDDAEAVSRLRQTLEAEARLAPPGELCLPVNYRTGQPIQVDPDELIFGSSEYVKDGLISVYERYGDEAVYQRMAQVLDAILAHSRHDSPLGPLPSSRSEPNGNLLQMYSRLSHHERANPAWAEMAARLADAVVTQMLPANHGLPAHKFDYGCGRVVEAKTMLRDHGNELPVGLSEAYALAVHRAADDPLWAERAARWALPLADMYETILAHGFNADGLLGNELNPQTRELDDPQPSDNWGYLFSGMLLFIRAAQQHGQIAPARLDAMIARIEKAIHAVCRTDGLSWQGRNPDGYYDTLESAIYLARHFPDPTGHVRERLERWVDEQIQAMLDAQRNSGLVAGIYLDGNFIRTALLYADMKSGGWRLQPWSPHVRVGMFRSQPGQATVVVQSDRPYQGRLVPDTARHRRWLNLPEDWPRLNSWPQWCTDEDIREVVMLDDEAQTRALSLDEHRGIPLRMDAHDQIALKLLLHSSPASPRP